MGMTDCLMKRVDVDARLLICHPEIACVRNVQRGTKLPVHRNAAMRADMMDMIPTILIAGIFSRGSQRRGYDAHQLAGSGAGDWYGSWSGGAGIFGDESGYHSYLSCARGRAASRTYLSTDGVKTTPASHLSCGWPGMTKEICMRVLGVDPGCHGIAWAIFNSDIQDIEAWGEIGNWQWYPDWIPPLRQAAIELPVIFPGAGNSVRDTLVTTGHWLHILGPDTLLIPRATIAAALHAKGDQAINRVMAKLCPALHGTHRGLNGHHRAAAAVALVAAGRIKV